MTEQTTYKKLNIKAEVMITELLANDQSLNINNIALQPTGGFNKSVKWDVDEVIEEENEHGLYIQKFMLVRKGLFEALPEGLFYGDGLEEVSDQEQERSPVPEIIRQRENDKQIRKLFSPFDQLFHRYRLHLEIEERKVLTGFPEGSQHALCEMIYGNFHGVLSNYQKSILVSLLPMAHHIVGEIKYIEMAMTAVLGHQISIQKRYQENVFSDHSQPHVQPLQLGENFTLGQTYKEICVEYEIFVTNIKIEEAEKFIPGQVGDQTLEILCDYFIPIEASYTYKYDAKTKPLEIVSSLMDKKRGTNILGYTIHL